ncbi:hypothetical protein [Streptomyces carpinensis]|uniref:hypothetical protein n=1 Tax=Streptomyces carpinensis TaxID=66369 RepID=UPI000A37152A|nr:hypothetical protein [Streptomyces carpinensis]
MAEHDSDREGRENREPVEPARPAADPNPPADPDGSVGPVDPAGSDGPGADEGGAPFDEEAAWAAIVAGYGEEPADPPGARPYRPIEDLMLPDAPDGDDERPRTERPKEEGKPTATKPPLGGSVSFAPGVANPGAGPRDYALREPSDEDFDEGDEGHFVPPEPPPLPEADAAAKFAWLGVIGGPVLLLLAVLLGWDMTWWLTTLCIGGFLGGVVTLVARMKPGDDEDDDPGRGAVV